MNVIREKESLIPLYVIGYPKSGNTWLARLLAEVTQSNIAIEDSLDVVNAADNSPDRKGKYLIYKLHGSEGVFLPDDARVVYIVRDIRDVLVSAFFFNNDFFQKDIVRLNSGHRSIKGWLCKDYFRHQVRRMNKRWRGNELSVLKNFIYCRKNKVGSWSSHVTYWTHLPGVVVVKYEDLVQNTEGEMVRVLTALNIDASDDVLRGAISNQSLEKRRVAFLSSGDDKNAKFLRSGRVGNWRSFLSSTLAKEIEKRHARVMVDNGYKLEFYKEWEK